MIIANYIRPWAKRWGTFAGFFSRDDLGERRQIDMAETVDRTRNTTEMRRSAMDFPRRLDRARNLSDLAEIGKRAVEAAMGRSHQWVAGDTMEDALHVAREVNARGLDALINHLGEHHRDKAPVEATSQEYVRLLAAMRSNGIRGGVSLKPTQFGLLLGREYALSQILPVLDEAKKDGRTVWLDMESAPTTDDAIWICERLLERHDQVGICLQANLKRTSGDLERLLRAGARIRLVKGAYKESPDVALQSRAEIDRAYMAHLETLFTRARDFAVATHDDRMVARTLELAKAHPTPFDFAMLQGVRDPLERELIGKGQRVEKYISYGPKWLPYFSRRLREWPRDILVMVRSFVGG